MERVKLLVGNKEVEKRYVGNKLVWQKGLLKYLEGCYVEIKQDKLILVANDNRFTNTTAIRRVTFNDEELEGLTSITFENYKYNSTLSNQAAFINKMKWEDLTNKTNVTVKFFER